MPTANAEATVDVADHLFTAVEQSNVAMLNQILNNDIAVRRVGTSRRRITESGKEIQIHRAAQRLFKFGRAHGVGQ